MEFLIKREDEDTQQFVRPRFGRRFDLQICGEGRETNAPYAST